MGSTVFTAFTLLEQSFGGFFPPLVIKAVGSSSQTDTLSARFLISFGIQSVQGAHSLFISLEPGLSCWGSWPSQGPRSKSAEITEIEAEALKVAY